MADVLVVQKATESAASNDTVLVDDDTDLLILLCCNSKSTNCELYLRPEPKSNSQRAAQHWSINQVQRVEEGGLEGGGGGWGDQDFRGEGHPIRILGIEEGQASFFLK